MYRALYILVDDVKRMLVDNGFIYTQNNVWQEISITPLQLTASFWKII